MDTIDYYKSISRKKIIENRRGFDIVDSLIYIFSLIVFLILMILFSYSQLRESPKSIDYIITIIFDSLFILIVFRGYRNLSCMKNLVCLKIQTDIEIAKEISLQVF